ncbi:hypothetical protein BH23PAT2_BH23PAT2_09450 [soil metagenome]
MLVFSNIKNLSLGKKFLLGAIILGTIHFIDHIMRFDHSGWPFKPDVSPFTFIVPFVYILIAVAWIAHSKPKLRLFAAGLLALLTILAHSLIEPPSQIYKMWANNHSAPALIYPGDPSAHNLLHVESPLLGVLSILIVVLLVIFTMGAFISLIKETSTPTTLS